MGPDLLTPVACPACSAALRPGAPWCTLCYADLRPPEPEPPPGPGLGVEHEPDPRTRATPTAVQPTGTGWPGEPPPAPAVPAAQALPHQPAGWPCATCAAVNDLDLASCAGCGAPFLAALAADPPAFVLPGVGDVTRLSPPQRYALVGAVVVVVVLLTALLGLL